MGTESLGALLRKLFVSYARENRRDIDQLVEHLSLMGYDTWVDTKLRGGQDWWEEVLQRIANSDVFIPIISRAALASTACQREFDWAEALARPVLPVAVEPTPTALPRRFARRQIIDYSQPQQRDRAALMLQGGLGTVPPPPTLPDPLPEPPAAPLSYLTDLVDLVAHPDPIDHAQQHQILQQLGVALRSADPEERRGGRYVLETFSNRNDLYADVDRTLAQLGLTQAARSSPTPSMTGFQCKECGAENPPNARFCSSCDVYLGWDTSPTAPEATAGGRGNLLADPQWVDALNAYFAKRWVDAVDRFEALQGRYPGESRVKTRLEQARRQRDIAAWSEQADAAARAEDWDTVVTALENLTVLDPTYPDAAARLEQARTAQRRRALVEEMTALHQAGRWDAVVAAAEELARLDPDDPDPGGIVSDAKAKIRDAELADRYAQAINHLDQEEWQQAADLFTAIEQEQPGFRDAAALLTTAQRQRDLAAWSDQADAAAGHDDWDTALTALENLCAVDPTYRDGSARLERARSAKRLRLLVDKVTALHQAGRWKEVVAAAKELGQLDPDHPDPGGMISDARAKLREAAQRIADLQDKLREYATANNWQSVIDVNDELAALDPDLADPDGLATQAHDALRAQAEATEREERYTQARAAENAGNWRAAISHYRDIIGYRDAETRLHSCQERQKVPDLTSTPGASGGEQTTQQSMAALNRRTKIVLAVGFAFAVVAVAVVAIVAKQSQPDPTQQLLAMVRSDDHCAPAPGDIHPAEAVATVVCSPDAAVVSGLVYSLFPDQATLNSDFNSGVIRPEYCPGMSQSPQNWHGAANPQQNAGRVECWVADDGVPHMRWTIDSQLLIGSADGPRGETIDQVYQWWANRYEV